MNPNYPLVPAPIQAREIPQIQQQYLDERQIHLFPPGNAYGAAPQNAVFVAPPGFTTIVVPPPPQQPTADSTVHHAHLQHLPHHQALQQLQQQGQTQLTDLGPPSYGGGGPVQQAFAASPRVIQQQPPQAPPPTSNGPKKPGRKRKLQEVDVDAGGLDNVSQVITQIIDAKITECA